MEHIIEINGTEDLPRAAEEFLRLIDGHKVVAFYAPMGAGKTTFTSALCACLKVEDDVCSPTFTIINEYRTAGGETIFHFDLYRINRESEALDLGLDDYFYSGNLCLIEWPERIETLLPEDCLKVAIEVIDANHRRIRWTE